MRRILFTLVAMLFVVGVCAQEGRRPQREPRKFNPEAMAQMQTERLNSVLQLDSVQFQMVFLMNYADALTMQDSITARRERMEKMRAEGRTPQRPTPPTEEQMKVMEQLRKEREQVRNERMQQLLTPEQYEKYLKYQEEQRNRMRRGPGRGGNRAPGGRGPRG
ncbi:MAG: hypothetical protein IIV89_04355 [Bacteroidaceae bacterium]|nr:hypothetical protein [Bacteroidaceae bacterium]